MNDINSLLKDNDITQSLSNKENKRIAFTRKKMAELCDDLCESSEEYMPEQTVGKIVDMFNSDDMLDKMLYSQVSSQIYDLDLEERDRFEMNINALLIYVLNKENNVSQDCVNFVTKLYDHFQLVVHQIENTEVILYSGAEKVRTDLQSELKGIQKEYITILGIFASVVLTFVGGLVFTSSILQNMHQVSIYRLVFVIALLGLVVFDVIMILIKFLYDINDSYIDIIGWFIGFNAFVAIICVLDLILWLFNFTGLKDYIAANLIPW